MWAVLTTARLVLEPLTVAAAGEMVAVLADPELYGHTGGEPPSLATLAERYGRQVTGASADGTERWLNWIVRVRGSGEAVGYVQATVTVASGEAEVAWVIGKAFQGRGYATEAARALVGWLNGVPEVTRIAAHIGRANVPSQAVARRLGFVETADEVDGEVVWEQRQTRVVVSTHLDDAVLSAYSLLAPGTTVVTVLAGFPPAGTITAWDRLTGATDSRDCVAARRVEDSAAIARSGARAVHLDFADEQYVDIGVMPAPAPADVAEALRPHVGDGELYVPAGIGNTDHVRVRDAVLAAWPDAVLYADLPYTLRDGWELPAGLPRRAPIDETLEEPVLAAKLAAVRAYATQVSHLVSLFGDFVTADGLGRERTWRPGA